jgi:hypothetical protein
MKMVWSWWPNIGFEPRYGGDIAFGAFAIDGYLTFNTTFRTATEILRQIDRLTGNNTGVLPENATATYSQAKKLITAAAQNFNLGWYAIARAQADDAVEHATTALHYIELIMPLKQTNQILLGIIAVILALIVISNLYWHRRLTRSTGRSHHKQKRN